MSKFDWVKARSDCTVPAIFRKLAEDAKNDVDRFAHLHPGLAQSNEFGECGKDRFDVGRKQPHRVVVGQKESEIHIVRWAYTGDSTPLMELTVSLDDNGKCVLIDENQQA